MTEQDNFYRFLLRRPLNLARLVFVSQRPLFLHLKRIMKKVQQQRKKSDASRLNFTCKNLFFERFPFTIDHHNNANEFREINLAGMNVPVDDKPEWSRLFNDIENTFSLNRFGWLLTAIHVRPSAELASCALKWIINWIDVMGLKKDHPAWESYSVSERLANWPFILSVVNAFGLIDKDMEKELASSIEDHIRYLMENLELRDQFTNNHILNNARGLYIGGFAVGNEDAIEKARELFREWIPSLIDHEGLLKEDSSHYQMLISQRLEQVLLLSRSVGDDSFTSFINQWFIKMKKISDFFHVHSEGGQCYIPLIGDVSPDFPPDWLSPISSKGWKKIRDSHGWHDSSSLDKNSVREGMITAISDRYFIYCCDDLTVYWHVPDGPVRDGTHGHFDIGSFILFFNGREIITDPGMFSYEPDGSPMAHARAHTGMMIDGLGPFCEDSRLNLINAYPFQKANASIATTGGGTQVLTIDVDGFRRLVDPIKWTRSFFLEKERMIIRDEIRSRQRHTSETRFIFADDIVVEETREGINMISQNGSLSLKILDHSGIEGLSHSIEKNEISRRYGHSSIGTSYVVKSIFYSNCSSVYEMRWDS